MNKRFVVALILTLSPAQGQAPGTNMGRLTVTVGRSLVIDSSVNIQRVSVANRELVEAVAVNPRQVLINGKSPGETSLVVEQENGNRLLYDLTIRPSPAKLETVPQQISREFPMEGQILLKVRFASVDRNVETDLGLNLVRTAFNQTTATSTRQFGPPSINSNSTGFGQNNPTVTSQPMNIFLFRPDIDLLATIRALQARNALEMLAEPNVMAIDGKQASFVAGGEFPFPTQQGGVGVGAVTIQFREVGVRLDGAIQEPSRWSRIPRAGPGPSGRNRTHNFRSDNHEQLGITANRRFGLEELSQQGDISKPRDLAQILSSAVVE
jgi:pilus assembly protein CpaC